MSSVRRFFSIWGSAGNEAANQTNGRPHSDLISNGSSTTLDLDDESDNFTTSFEWNSEFASDPSEWERSFKTEWEQLQKAMKRPVKQVRDVREVCNHLEVMCKLLVMEVNSLPMAQIGQLLELVFSHDIYKRVGDWTEKVPLFLAPTCQVMLLRIYEGLVTQNHSQTHCLLVHKPILLPLLELLQWCQKSAKERCFQQSSIDKHFVLLLHQICIKISLDGTLLDFFFNPHCSDEMDDYKEQQPFLVFNLLISYIYSSNDVAHQARDALLLILTASNKLDFVAKHVADDSNFCPVLATGLSGCYSQLPGFICEALRARDDEFHKIYVNRTMDSVPELYDFYNSLLFCNAVVQASHRRVACQIVKFFYDGFLVEVVKPSLLQSDPDKLVSRIAYFHLCLETITEPAMVHTMLKLLTAAETNVSDMNLLETILHKMNSSDRLCRVVLSFLRTLLSLRCEDFMWMSLLRYCVPFIKMRPQKLLFDPTICMNAADSFLSCIPKCVSNVQELVSPATFNTYNQEAFEMLRATRRKCGSWAFKYDGLTPNNLLNLNTTEESLSSRQPFTRLSSARSSMASTAWNRYFQSRSAHATTDSVSMYAPDSGRLPLNQLGEDDILLNLSDEEAVLPLEGGGGSSNGSVPDEMFTSNYELMTASNTEYFQFAYDGISESDESSRHNSCDDDETNREGAEKKAPEHTGIPLPPAKQRFLGEVRAQNWQDASDSVQSLGDTLGKLTYEPKWLEGVSVEESISLINARYQHLIELKAELQTSESERKAEANPLKLNLTNGTTQQSNGKPNGLLMTCTTEKGAGYFYEALITALEMMVEHNFTTNIQLASVFEHLASFPQPVIAALVLYSDALKSNTVPLPRLLRVLEKLKLQVDAFASSVDTFEDLIRRGARNRLRGRSEPLSAKRVISARNPTFRHLQLARENGDTAADSARTKNFAYAAIVLSQLCQQLAAFSIQQCPTYGVS
ncbi:hypothetical protein M3Y99_00867200 [Aphelenchoides fujianensis]|nr:hypothetical protein M3Y99_00867200 [Aphelenchoides fujianensis]